MKANRVTAKERAVLIKRRQAVERDVALRFLSRARRLWPRLPMNGAWDGKRDAQHEALWRVVVAASHKSGTWDGKRRKS